MIQSLLLNGNSVNLDNISSYPPKSEFEKDTLRFITEWLSQAGQFVIETSGSTGKPKAISITKEQMVASAKATNAFFNLKKGDKVHLCLNTKFIAGQMMLVRAIVGSLHVIAEEPSANPDSLNKEYGIHFSALIPIQAKDVLKQGIKAKNTSLKGIIIGGAPIDRELEQLVNQQDIPIYATFGMTETVSHIALKALNGPFKSDQYTSLPGVVIGCKNECLTIKGAVTKHEEIITNDRVEITSPNSFKWLGRKDNVINSGGIKIQLEEVEQVIQRIVAGLNMNNRIICASQEDTKLGEKLILIVEGELTKENKELLMTLAKKELPKYWAPKELLVRNQFPETGTGKINRKAISV